MRNRIVWAVLLLFLTFGCARIKVEAPKEPIKVDISMRLDIYQHVEKDITDIENIVSGSKGEENVQDKGSLLNIFMGTAFAEEGLDTEVQKAALRRKERYAELLSWEKKGVLGEDKSGLVAIRERAGITPELEDLVKAENSGRMFIYEAIAKKNGISLQEVQALYAKRLQNDAPQGAPIEAQDSATGQYKWEIKL